MRCWKGHFAYWILLGGCKTKHFHCKCLQQRITAARLLAFTSLSWKLYGSIYFPDKLRRRANCSLGAFYETDKRWVSHKWGFFFVSKHSLTALQCSGWTSECNMCSSFIKRGEWVKTLFLAQDHCFLGFSPRKPFLQPRQAVTEQTVTDSSVTSTAPQRREGRLNISPHKKPKGKEGEKTFSLSYHLINEHTTHSEQIRDQWKLFNQMLSDHSASGLLCHWMVPNYTPGHPNLGTRVHCLPIYLVLLPIWITQKPLSTSPSPCFLNHKCKSHHVAAI